MPITMPRAVPITIAPINEYTVRCSVAESCGQRSPLLSICHISSHTAWGVGKMYFGVNSVITYHAASTTTIARMWIRALPHLLSCGGFIMGAAVRAVITGAGAPSSSSETETLSASIRYLLRDVVFVPLAGDGAPEHSASSSPRGPKRAYVDVRKAGRQQKS